MTTWSDSAKLHARLSLAKWCRAVLGYGARPLQETFFWFRVLHELFRSAIRIHRGFIGICNSFQTASSGWHMCHIPVLNIAIKVGSVFCKNLPATQNAGFSVSFAGFEAS